MLTSEQSNSDNRLLVFFDGGCPLCSREIRHYQRLAPDAPVSWIDVCATQPAPELIQWNISPEQAMAEFHVVKPDGQLAKGADGFLALWQTLPYYRWLAKLCVALRLPPLLRWLYKKFAAWHFRKRCAEGFCRTDER